MLALHATLVAVHLFFPIIHRAIRPFSPCRIVVHNSIHSLAKFLIFGKTHCSIALNRLHSKIIYVQSYVLIQLKNLTKVTISWESQYRSSVLNWSLLSKLAVIKSFRLCKFNCHKITMQLMMMIFILFPFFTVPLQLEILF